MSKPGCARMKRSEIHLKHKRRAKVRKLKARFLAAKSEDEKKAVLEKLFRLAPEYPLSEFQST